MAEPVVLEGEVVTLRSVRVDDWGAGAGRHPGSRPTGARGTPRTAEIGATWLAASVQRSAVNTEAKLLMLRYAFDRWDVECITFKTDRRNARSRAAIERLGAQLEGIRRAHVPASDGSVCDSAYCSIIRSEWPEVRAGLEARLARGTKA
jgi:RimJ/RimL family protein N-acetyltransferase